MSLKLGTKFYVLISNVWFVLVRCSTSTSWGQGNTLSEKIFLQDIRKKIKEKFSTFVSKFNDALLCSSHSHRDWENLPHIDRCLAVAQQPKSIWPTQGKEGYFFIYYPPLSLLGRSNSVLIGFVSERWQAGWWWNMGHVVRLETTSLDAEATTPRRPNNGTLTQGDQPRKGPMKPTSYYYRHSTELWQRFYRFRGSAGEFLITQECQVFIRQKPTEWSINL